MTSDRLSDLLAQYADLQSQRAVLPADEYTTKAKRLRKLVRDAGGSVTALSGTPDKPRAPRQQRPAKADGELRAKSAKRSGREVTGERDDLHRTSTRGSSAPRYKAATQGLAPTAEDIVRLEQSLALRQDLRYVPYNMLGRMGPAGLGLGFVVWAGTELSAYLEKYSKRYPALTPTWWSISKSSEAFQGGSVLLVIGPVEKTDHTADVAAADDMDADGGVDEVEEENDELFPE